MLRTLNEQGEVVGWVDTDESQRPFVYRAGRSELLHTPEGAGAIALAINESGTIGGNRTGFPCNRGLVWDPNGAVRTLPNCDEFVEVNDAGVALVKVGSELELDDGSIRRRVVRPYDGCWGSVVFQGAWPAGRSRARISVGEVVAAQTSDGFCKVAATTWVSRSAGTLVSVCPRPRACSFGGVNGLGTALISAWTSHSDPHELFLWKNDGRVKLGSYNADTEARGINRREEAIAMDRGIAVLWRDGGFYRIQPSELAWGIEEISEINDASQIVGHAVYPATGQRGAVLLDPVER